MEIADTTLTTIGVETPIVHIVSVNGERATIAYQMQYITLIGLPTYHGGFEYRTLNIATHAFINILSLIQPNPKYAKIFTHIKKIVKSHMKDDALLHDKYTIKNITKCGIDVCIVYFILHKYLLSIDHVYNTGNADNIIFNVLDAYAGNLDSKEIAVFANAVLQIGELPDMLNSKLSLITIGDVEHTNDLKLPLWKEIYIHKVISLMPRRDRKHMQCLVDWIIMKYPTKQLFFSKVLTEKIAIGEGIHYLKTSASKQRKLVSAVEKLGGKSFQDIQGITSQLVSATSDIDYALDDIAVAMFYDNTGHPLSELLSDKVISQICINTKKLRQFVFQYMISVLSLSTHGIMHNAPTMDNILIRKHDPTELVCILPDGTRMSAGNSSITMALSEFGNAILSDDHHCAFADISKYIETELNIVFAHNKSISTNYDCVFCCYVMYDVIRFILMLKNNISDHDCIEFMDSILKLATRALQKIYLNDNTDFDPHKGLHSSMIWLVKHVFKDFEAGHESIVIVEPSFISKRRKYADSLKMQFIGEFATKLNMMQN